MSVEAAGMEELQRELNLAREERDLCRALLLTDDATARRLKRALTAAVQRIPALIRQTARDSAGFRQKLQRLNEEMQQLGELAGDLSLPIMAHQIETVDALLNQLRSAEEPTGDELLPIVPMIDGVLTTLRAACPVTHTLRDPEPAAASGSRSLVQSLPRNRMEQALQQLVTQLTGQFQKELRLELRGLEHAPEDWHSALFDVGSQLLRNAVEHGLEAPAQREAAGKPRVGSIEIEFLPMPRGFEFSVRDDGRGLDFEGILDAGVRCGVEDMAGRRDPRRAATLIFMPGVTTAMPADGRGNGMHIVREQIRRLGGRMQISSKKGRSTDVRATLPPTKTVAVTYLPHA